MSGRCDFRDCHSSRDRAMRDACHGRATSPAVSAYKRRRRSATPPGRRRAPPLSGEWRGSPPSRRKSTSVDFPEVFRHSDDRTLADRRFRYDNDGRRNRHERVPAHQSVAARDYSSRDYRVTEEWRRRPRRVAPPPPPGFESSSKAKSGSATCEEGELNDDHEYEEGEWMGDERGANHAYGAHFCSPIKIETDSESLRNPVVRPCASSSQSPSSSSSNKARSEGHPVVEQSLRQEGGDDGKKDADNSSSQLNPPLATATADEIGKSLDELEEVQESKVPLTMSHLRRNCEYQLLDKALLTHLSELNPISALHELSQKLGWGLPNLKVAFECGPPMMKMFIYKAVVNGEEFQPAVAVDNKKDAKANAAWFALQEMGFVKLDLGNPL